MTKAEKIAMWKEFLDVVEYTQEYELTLDDLIEVIQLNIEELE